jgi:acyl transferase domain-containing protein
MDPKQRLMLELCWEALEDAGIPPRSLSGIQSEKRVGVFAGVLGHDYAELAGGVNIVLSPGFSVELTKFGGLSGDGRCKAFDARADGFARGEGGGIVVLKPLSAALRDGDPVWCVIRGGAVNNDGASNGLTAPSPQAQIEVLADAYALWAAGRPVRWEALHPDPDTEGPAELLPLSARTPEALRDLAQSTAALLRERPPEDEPATHCDVARAAAVHRTHHEHRMALTGRSRADFAAKLDAFAAGEAVQGLVAGRKARSDRGGLVFVFAGQGPQWPGMGRELLAQERVFRETFEQCDELLRPHLGESLFHALDREGSLDHTSIAQPALFALEVSLAALWRSWGIEPDAVVGHSVGEIAAAWAAGVLSLEDAARVAAVRGRSMEPACGQGAMAAVELSERPPGPLSHRPPATRERGGLELETSTRALHPSPARGPFG